MATKKTSTGSAPQVIHELVARFAEQHDVYRRGQYNEAMLRQDFLDPFFAAMGWDIDNRKGYAEAFREVVHEDSLKVEASTKQNPFTAKSLHLDARPQLFRLMG